MTDVESAKSKAQDTLSAYMESNREEHLPDTFNNMETHSHLPSQRTEVNKLKNHDGR